MQNTTVRKTHLDFLAMSCLFACCVLWGAQQVLVKATMPYFPPVLQAVLRFALAAVSLFAWCQYRGIKLFVRDGTLGVGIAAGTLFALEFVALYVGLQHTSASRLTIFLYTSPFVVALVLPWFLPSERLRTVQWLGLVCAFVAVVFVLSDAAKPGPWWADVLALAAGAFWGMTTVVIRTSKLVTINPARLLFYQLVVSCVLMPFVSLGLGEVWSSVQWTAFSIASIAVQGVVGAFASYLVWMWLLGRYPATLLSSFVFLTPVFSLIFGAWWLGDAVTVNVVCALVLVGVGIVLVNRR